MIYIGWKGVKKRKFQAEELSFIVYSNPPLTPQNESVCLENYLFLKFRFFSRPVPGACYFGCVNDTIRGRPAGCKNNIDNQMILVVSAGAITNYKS